MKYFLLRTIKIGIVLNLPPLLVALMVYLKLDIFPIIFTALLWASIPLQSFGMGSLFTESQITFNEWGVSQASPAVWVSIVMFWLLWAALISFISLLRISRK
ncbi:hypothetical protein BFR57_05965 [Idiomarina sp. MD25a]|nr:hypothetical protein BFR57_05965 [Idiomarina sp. MD25a]